MTFVSKYSIAIFVFVASVNAAKAATVSTDNVVDSLGWTQTQINQTIYTQLDSSYNRASQINSDVIKLKQENLLRDDAIKTSTDKVDQALHQTLNNGTDIIMLKGDVSSVDTIARRAGALADTADKKADAALQGVVTNGSDIVALKSSVNNLDKAVKQNGIVADTASHKADNALQQTVKNGSAILNIENVNKVQDYRLDALEHQPKAKAGIKGDKGDRGAAGASGKNGMDGKNGVTTTIIKADTATQAKVAANTKAITATANQSAAVTKDLQDAKKFFVQQQAASNTQFKSLRDEVDNNKKEARGGVASAIAIASMPQVETAQSMMISAGVGAFRSESALSVGASFHAGSAVVKAGISDSTDNDLALGAGVGIGF